MKIDILAREGSPIGVTVKSIYGQDGRVGVGGAELALLTMCEEWHKAGHQVTLYNSPTDPNGSSFTQRMVPSFNGKEDRDVLIIFRSPLMNLHPATKGLKVWWSCDQQTVGDFREFNELVDKTVCISPNHADYFKRNYGIDDAIVIDIPVRVQDYDLEVEKVPGQLLFSSVPDRGLEQMKLVWDIVSEDNPDASLIVTSDYRLWGSLYPQNERFRLMFSRSKNVRFMGGIPRGAFVKLQLESDVLPYPCVYDELFCISVAEAQVAGAYPITSRYGSLPTTNMGEVILGDPNTTTFVREMADKIAFYLNSPQLHEVQTELQKLALERFSPEKILADWDEYVFK
jgi:hypothetical protein